MWLRHFHLIYFVILWGGGEVDSSTITTIFEVFPDFTASKRKAQTD